MALTLEINSARDRDGGQIWQAVIRANGVVVDIVEATTRENAQRKGQYRHRLIARDVEQSEADRIAAKAAAKAAAKRPGGLFDT